MCSNFQPLFLTVVPPFYNKRGHYISGLEKRLNSVELAQLGKHMTGTSHKADACTMITQPEESKGLVVRGLTIYLVIDLCLRSFSDKAPHAR
jgi:hypothetical protein